jgi:UDP-N-acetylmuramoyl-tripeptide--D-alanyl-D-alanine ligase
MFRTGALWTAEALAEATGGELTPGGATAEVESVAIDTRRLAPGALFIALRGENGDGHAHVGAALAAGARLVMVHEPVPGPALVVGDTLAGLHALGRAGRARFGGRVIAVTGSVGKTTVKEMLRAAMAPAGVVHAAEASFNNHWGVPLTLARLPRSASFCVSEIGTNHPGEIAPLADLVRPDVAVVTAIGTAHVGLMGGIEAIAREKASLFGALRAGGVAVLPVDAAHVDVLRAAVPAGVRVVGFGTGVGASARLVGVEAAGEAWAVSAVVDGRAVRFGLQAAGRHMALNAVAVLGACVAAGVELEVAAEGLGAFRTGAGRGLVRPILGGRSTLLDESYNASGASVRAALEVLALLPAERRLAFLGDMLELGAWAEAEHRVLAEPAAEAADLVFCCGPSSRALFEALPERARGLWAPDAESLAREVASIVRTGDAVLVKGSNGSRMRLVVEALLAVDDGNG